MAENKEKTNREDPSGIATHSGWNHFYILFSKYRDECIKIGQVVFGTNQNTSLKYLKNYHSALYSMAQQVFSFYDDQVEKDLTDKWFDLGSDINEVMFFVGDRDFKRQMDLEGKEAIPKELKTKLIMFFNKIDRLAAEAGLLVGKENKGLNEPKKGLLGFGGS